MVAAPPAGCGAGQKTKQGHKLHCGLLIHRLEQNKNSLRQNKSTQTTTTTFNTFFHSRLILKDPFRALVVKTVLAESQNASVYRAKGTHREYLVASSLALLSSH